MFILLGAALAATPARISITTLEGAPVSAPWATALVATAKTCLESVEADGKGSWYGRLGFLVYASGGFGRDDQPMFPRPDYDAATWLSSCIADVGVSDAAEGIYTLRVDAPAGAPIVVDGLTGTLAEEVTLVTQACLAGWPTAVGRLTLSREGDNPKETHGVAVFPDSDALREVAWCTAARLTTRTDAPMKESDGVAVTIAPPVPAPKVSAPKGALIRSSTSRSGVWIAELYPRKVGCEDAPKPGERIYAFQFSEGRATTELPGRGFDAGWYGDREGAVTPLWATAGRLTAPATLVGEAEITVAMSFGAVSLPETRIKAAVCP